VEVLIVLSKGTTHQLNLMIRLDLVKRGNSRGWRSVTPELPVGLLWRPLKILAVLIDDRETAESIVRVSFQTTVFAVLTLGE